MTSETGRRRSGSSTGGIQEGAAAVAEQAGRTAEAQVSGMLVTAGDALDQVSKAVRQAGQSLRDERPELAGVADTAAERVHDASEYLRTHQASELMDAAQDFARRQPAIVIGGGLLLGFALGRFLRAAQPQGQGDGYGRGDDRSAVGYGGGTYGRPAPGYGAGYGSGAGYGAYGRPPGYGAGRGYGAGDSGTYRGSGQGAYGAGADYGPESEEERLRGGSGAGTGYGSGRGAYAGYAGAAAAGTGGGFADDQPGMSRTEIEEQGTRAGMRTGETGLGGTSQFAAEDLEASEDLGTTGGSELPGDVDRDEPSRGG